MEPVTLTAVVSAIATILLTKPLEKIGENIGFYQTYAPRSNSSMA
ncbi:MAG: hypothetical protein V7L11_18545 [Nostoc sp.]